MKAEIRETINTKNGKKYKNIFVTLGDKVFQVKPCFEHDCPIFYYLLNKEE